MVTISARNDIHSYLVPVGHSLQAVMLARRPSHYVNELADKSSRQPALIFYCQPLFLPLSFSLSPKGPFLLRQHAIKKRTSAILLSRPQGPLIFRCHVIKRTSAILLPPFPPLFASARESGYLPCPKRQNKQLRSFFRPSLRPGNAKERKVPPLFVGLKQTGSTPANGKAHHNPFHRPHTARSPSTPLPAIRFHRLSTGWLPAYCPR